MLFSKTAKTRFKLLICALLAVQGGWLRSAEAREIVDATRTRVILTRDRPDRIVTLVPSLGELVSDLVGSEGMSRIVGVSEYSDFPSALKKVRSVGPYHRFNLERVMELKPDLVLATLDGNSKDQVDHLRELGIPVVVVTTSSLGEVAASMKLVGVALGDAAGGGRMADRFENELGKIRQEGSRRHPRRPVFLQLGEDPLFTAGRGSFLQSAIDSIGARNIYEETGLSYPKPSREDVVAKKPEVILVLTMGGDAAPFQKMAERWKEYPSVPAVKSGRVRVVPGDEVLRPTLRLIHGLKTLRDAVYGAD